ncbi:hypothetical protein [Phenylobacterium sp.]|uniref:hypothetical protein n=1 Tax=Phenylobacterium sp. TaxID=1871053 RepID=UPI002ED83750
MAKPPPKPPIFTVTGATMNFTQAGTYTFDYLTPGKVKVLLDGGQATFIKTGDFNAITVFNIAAGATVTIGVGDLGARTTDGAGELNVMGVSFRAADVGPEYNFEPLSNLDGLLNALFGSGGDATGWGDNLESVFERLTVNGNEADTIKLVWDFLDGLYVQAGYGHPDINEAFVRLGVQYADYLADGGAPLTTLVAKYVPDGGDAGGIADRLQSMHDNLLGNFNDADLVSRFGTDPVLYAELKALIPDDLENRGAFSGNESALGGAAHDQVRAVDWDHGWSRPDWLDVGYNAVVDARAQDPGGTEMIYGDGNTIDDWNTVRHEGAGFELALKVKHRQGDEYGETSVDPDGTANYTVLSGAQSGAPNRAEWNFDFAATILPAGDDDDITFKLFIDIDPTEGESFVEIPLTDEYGAPYGDQNSANYAFFSSLIDTDPGTEGVQPYAFGEGTFTIRLEGYVDGVLAATNAVRVFVDDPLV